jgi:hypothetical protein
MKTQKKEKMKEVLPITSLKDFFINTSALCLKIHSTLDANAKKFSSEEVYALEELSNDLYTKCWSLSCFLAELSDEHKRKEAEE